MKHLLLSLTILFGIFSFSQRASSQSNPVPTFVPPTPIPTIEPTQNDALLSQSAVARIGSSGMLRVGVLFNEPPYAELTIRGEVTGFEADLARAIAEAWDVELELVQVTRTNRIEMLRAGEIDLLMAATVHHRVLDEDVEFSQTYRVSKQTMMVRAADNLPSLVSLANRPIGFVLGTPAEMAINDWMANRGVPVQAQSYLTLDGAFGALFAGDIDGIVANQERLLRVASNQLEAISIFDEAIEREPYAIAMQRQDVNLRNLVNRTLQFLLQDAPLNSQSTLESLHNEYFPGDEFVFDALPVWDNVGDDAPSPSQFSADVTFPQQYVTPRLLADRVLRVAGIQEAAAELPPDQQLIAPVNRAVVEQLASRWGVRVELVQGDPMQLVQSGQADIAVGAAPDWNLSDRVDFSQPYLLHGDRLLVPSNRDFQRFTDLRGRVVATIIGDEGARERANAWAESVTVRIRPFETLASDVTLTMLENLNADVTYGDSLLLIPHARNNPTLLEFGPRWYSRDYIAFVLPRNDIDFRLLVNYTLQEMLRDNSLRTLLAPVIPPEEGLPQFDFWPGSGEHLGLRLRR